MEFAPLVVGRESELAAHLTRLSDHRPLTRGEVRVELKSATGEPEVFTVNKPDAPGIFGPIIKPRASGRRQVTLTVEADGVRETHDLGLLMVHPDASKAYVENPAEDAEVSFLLEQQWRTRFGTSPVLEQTIRPNFAAFARLALPPGSESVVRAPRSGRVTGADGALPRVDQKVEAGQPLARVSAAPRAEVDPATLDLDVERASIEVEAAEREVARVTPLVSQGVVAQRRLDDARSALDRARAELKSATRRKSNLTQLQRARRSRDSISIPSPIAGTVSEVFVAQGAWVEAGTPIARVVTRETLWLDVSIPEDYIPRIKAISGVWFTLHGSERVWELGPEDLVFVGNELDPESHTLPARFRIDNAEGELYAGMSAQAHVVSEIPRTSLAIPASALVDDAGSTIVYVQTHGEGFERRLVRTGVRDGKAIEILEGVRAGEWVVSEGAYSVKLAATSTDSIGHGHAH